MTKFSFNSDTIEMQSVVKQSKPPIDKKLSKSKKIYQGQKFKNQKIKARINYQKHNNRATNNYESNQLKKLKYKTNF